MKAFRFGLEKILGLRKFHEEEAKIELGRAVGLLAELEAKISSLAEERARAAAAQFSSENGAREIQQYTYYLIRLDNTKERLLREAAQAELKVEAARSIFIEASRERKVLDKVKEKRYKEYRKEMFVDEAKVTDDVSISKSI